MCSRCQACKPTFPLRITIDAPSLLFEEAQHLVRTTQHALDDLNEYTAHHLRLCLGKSLTEVNKTKESERLPESDEVQSVTARHDTQEEVALTVKLNPMSGITSPVVELKPHSTVLDVSYVASQVPLTSSSSSILANTIAKALQDMFEEEQASLAHILSTSLPSGSNQHSSTGTGLSSQMSQSVSTSRDSRSGIGKPVPPELASKLARRMTRAMKYAPLYHITISLFTPNDTPSSWAIESAIEDYLSPLLESFAISNFTVDTQIQLYSAPSPSVQPEYDADLGAWTLKTEDLSGFINAAEWPLGPGIGAGPTLNFVIYVPDKKMAPLVVKEHRANSWLIPQWGGVTILNPPIVSLTTPSHLTKEAIQPALLTFSYQLFSLLGTPETPSSFPMQLQTLTRIRAASLLLSASSTMGSLARLTVALPSIAIPESVSIAVESTLSHLRSTCMCLRDGRFHMALEHAKIAEAEAEKGFFEKSMVGQVYFPDEHKVAVYLPLLGPVGVPLVMSAIKESKRLIALRRSSG